MWRRIDGRLSAEADIESIQLVRLLSATSSLTTMLLKSGQSAVLKVCYRR